ncbi:tetratricopeptide repeat protein [Scytonema sp. PCC 10023]|uniref:tetratricopeptide repeat protein n=1 Tax=Scytonema sp. PCC 10023 TaxID=1680591 RepID=UPI0039C6A04A
MAKQTKGLLVGRYQIIKELARGGFGVTYLAKDTQSSNSPCVVKKLNPQNADIETAKTLFQREAQFLSYLQQNRQIPKYSNYFEEDEEFYIVQEYIEGKSLDKLLEQLWTKPKVIDFLREILLILKHLHQINIIHRDIKPSNVIRRDKDNKFVLIDFGSVKQLEPRYFSKGSSQYQLPLHTMIGTPGYAPIEQMEGKPSFNSDIYGLGMTAIHLLTGIHPKNLKRNEQDNVIFPNGVDIDNSLATVLTKMVYSSPERRYQFVDDVLEDLNNVIESYNNNNHNNKTTIDPNNGFISLNEITAPRNDTIPFFIPENNETQLPKRTFLRLWHIPIGLIALGITLVSLEFIYPFLRPLYYSYQGDRLLDFRQPEAALEQFENLREIKPNSPEAWKGRGDALLTMGSDFRALDSYNKALSLQPNNLKTLNNKSKVLYNIGKYQEALETSNKVLAIDPNNAEALSGQGLAYMGLRQYEEASQSFEKLREIRPDEPKIWNDIALATEQLQGPEAGKNYYKLALESYDFLLKRKPQDPFAWTERGNILQKLNRPQDALTSYQKALEIDKNFYVALVGKGNTLDAIGKPQDALLAFNRASEIRPDDHQVWYNRGMLLAQRLQKYEEALQSFDKAIERRNDFYPAWLNKGLILLDLQRYSDALAAFDKAKNLAPKDAFVWANRGSALELLGKRKEAYDSYQKAIELGFPQEQLREQLEKTKV